jgi:hypothetical protein
VSKAPWDGSPDVAGIIAELHSILEGIEESIRILERAQAGDSSSETASCSLAGIETRTVRTSATREDQRRKRAACRRVGVK